MLKTVRLWLAVMAVGLFHSVPAFAQHPAVGIWELKVSGKYAGEKINGIAYLDFEADGGVEGYYLSRESESLVEVSGDWEGSGNSSFTGTVSLFDDGGNLFDTLDISGKAKAGKTLSAKLTYPGSSSSIKVSGKPTGDLSGLEGSYSGTLFQAGENAPIDIELSETDRDGVYELEGSYTYDGGTFFLTGVVLASRTGTYVAYIYNETDDVSSSIWGKIKVGSKFTGSGISLDNGSRIKVSMTPAG